MMNTISRLSAVAGTLLLLSSHSVTGGEPAPGAERLDGTPVIKRTRLAIAPAFPTCFFATGYTGVNCQFADLTIAGTCAGLFVSAALRNASLIDLFGLDANEDVTDITEEGLEQRLIPQLGNVLNFQNPNLQAQGCQILAPDGVTGRDYEIQKVKKFVNNAGVISAEMQLVPQD